MSEHSFKFSHALCRTPSKSVVNGLRADDNGDPDATIFAEQHRIYVDALRATGANVEVLDPLEEFPDSVFIEDAALCLKNTAICLLPGADSRKKEVDALRPSLKRIFPTVIDLQQGGLIDGGDILCTDDTVMVGLSARTNLSGAQQLESFVNDLGYSLEIFETPKGVLHFKTDCSLLDNETILSTQKLADSGCFKGFKVLNIPMGEAPAANSIRFNDTVFISEGYPKTADLVSQHGYHVTTLPTSEAAKVDGGLSCMSLRFSL